MMICYDDMLWYSSRDHRNQKICLFLLLFLLFRETLMVPSFYFKRLFHIVFFAEQPWFSHNLPLTSLSSLPCHLLRGVTVLNLDALFLPRNTKNMPGLMYPRRKNHSSRRMDWTSLGSENYPKKCTYATEATDPDLSHIRTPRCVQESKDSIHHGRIYYWRFTKYFH